MTGHRTLNRLLSASIVVAVIISGVATTLPPDHGIGLESLPAAIVTDPNDPTRFQFDPCVTNIEEVSTLASSFYGAFVENKGQLPREDVLFYAPGEPLSVSLGMGWVEYVLTASRGDWLMDVLQFRVTFEGADATCRPHLVDGTGLCSFFIGNDPEGWIRGAASSREVIYEGLWDGMDLRFLLADGRLKYEILVAPFADPSLAILRFEGVEGLRVDPMTGDLLVGTPLGTLREDAPVTYQLVGGLREGVDSAFEMMQGSRIGFQLAHWDPDCPLVIDPGLIFSSFFGGLGAENRLTSEQVSFDTEGNIYITGQTHSYDLPTTPGAFCGTVATTHQCYVAKFNPDVSDLLVCTYFGGNLASYPNAMAIDDYGNLHVVGSTNSADFPVTSDAVSTTKMGFWDGFYCKFNSTGTTLLYSTFIGGSEDQDGVSDIDMAPDKSVAYLVGFTESADFPTTTGAFDTSYGGEVDGFMMGFDTDSGELVFSTYVGGSKAETTIRCAMNQTGYPLVFGATGSSDMPVSKGAFCETFSGVADGFLMMVDKDGSSFVNSTYTGDVVFTDLRTATDGSLYTISSNSSLDYSICTLLDDDDGLAFALDPIEHDPNQGINYEIYDCLLDGPDRIVILTRSVAGMLCPKGAYDASFNGQTDAYLIWYDHKTGVVLNATYLGGSGHELVGGGAVFLAPNGTLIIVGDTMSANFPTTTNAFDRTFGTSEVFLSGLRFDVTPWEPPGPPQRLMVSPENGYAIPFWQPPTPLGEWPIVNYTVSARDPTGQDTRVEVDGSNLSAIVPGLTNGVTYELWVCATSIAGTGPRSQSVNVTPFGIPSPPTAFEATSGLGNVTLTWSVPDEMHGMEVLGYHIYRGPASDRLEPLAEVNGTTLRYVDADIVPGEVYHYALDAFHALANGTLTPVISALPFGPPGPPRDLRGEMGDRKVVLSWSPPLFDGGFVVTGYRVYRGLSPLELAPLGAFAPETTYTDTDVLNGVVYAYAVRARNAAAFGPLSDILTVTPMGPPGPPDGLQVEEGDGRVSLNWTVPANDGGSPITGYRVYRGPSESMQSRIADLGPVPGYIDEDVVNGISYHYTVRALSAVGEGAPTPAVMATPFGRPSAPGAITLDAGLSGVEVSWLLPTGDGGLPLVSYRVYRGMTPTSLTLSEVVAGETRWFLDKDVVAGTRYWYRVTAVNTRIEGLPSETADVMAVGLPKPPEHLEVVPGDEELTLSWEGPASTGGAVLEGYKVYQGTDPEALEPVRVLGNLTELTVPNLVNGRTYYFAVIAFTAIGSSPPSETVSGVPLGTPRKVGTLHLEVSGKTVIASWSIPEDDGGSPITGFLLLKGTAADRLDLVMELGNITTYTDVAVERGVTYYYSVLALNVVGNGTGSQTVSIEVPAEVPEDDEGASMLSGPLVWVFVVALGVLGVIGAMAATEPGKYRLVLLTIPLMSSRSKEELLENKNRYTIHGLIIDTPGIHYTAIVKEVDLPMGVVTYHLDVLEKERFIHSTRDGRLKCFYSIHARLPENPRKTPNDLREAIRGLVRDRPGISQMEIIEELGIERDTVGYHLRELIGEGHIEASKQGRFVVYNLKDKET